MECLYCGEKCPTKSDFFKRKRDELEHNANRKNKEDKALVAAAKIDKEPTEKALTASGKAFIDSRATAHMVENLLVDIGKAVPSDISIGTAGRVTVKATV